MPPSQYVCTEWSMHNPTAHTKPDGPDPSWGVMEADGSRALTGRGRDIKAIYWARHILKEQQLKLQANERQQIVPLALPQRRQGILSSISSVGSWGEQRGLWMRSATATTTATARFSGSCCCWPSRRRCPYKAQDWTLQLYYDNYVMAASDAKD